MKKGLLFFVLSFISVSIFAQAPQRFSYQAVIRDASNNLKTSGNVGVRISILQGSSSGSSVYTETHSAIAVNANGLITLQIGGGTVVSGTFNTINWGSNTYFLKTETDIAGGTNYTITSTTQLLSVPYALNAGNGLPSGGTNGQVLTIVNGAPTWQTPASSGGSNIIYSNWFSIDSLLWKGPGDYNYDYTWVGSQNATEVNAPSITQDVISKGVVLCYTSWSILSGTTPVVILKNSLMPVTTNYPNANGSTVNLNFGARVGKLDFYFYSAAIDVSRTNLSRIQYRYIIIPGSTLAGRRANGSSYPSVNELKKMRYEEVATLFNIPQNGSNE
ncbi:MAG: hypothetical protein ACK5BV_09715 [Bacteroidota bacterium]|jgi:hypothetical protein